MLKCCLVDVVWWSCLDMTHLVCPLPSRQICQLGQQPWASSCDAVGTSLLSSLVSPSGVMFYRWGQAMHKEQESPHVEEVEVDGHPGDFCSCLVWNQKSIRSYILNLFWPKLSSFLRQNLTKLWQFKERTSPKCFQRAILNLGSDRCCVLQSCLLSKNRQRCGSSANLRGAEWCLGAQASHL